MCDLKYTEKFIMSRFFYFFVLLPTDKWKKSIIDSKQTTIWNPMNQMSQLNYYFHCNVQYIWPTGSCMNHTMGNSNNINVVTDVCHTMCKCQSPNIEKDHCGRTFYWNCCLWVRCSAFTMQEMKMKILSKCYIVSWNLALLCTDTTTERLGGVFETNWCNRLPAYNPERIH